MEYKTIQYKTLLTHLYLQQRGAAVILAKAAGQILLVYGTAVVVRWIELTKVNGRLTNTDIASSST